MESVDRLDYLAASRVIIEPRLTDGIGLALRQTYPAVPDDTDEFAALLAMLDVIPAMLPGDSTLQLRP